MNETDSILNSIKKLLGITSDYDHFDSDIIIHINTILMVLTQVGVGPEEGYLIQDEQDEWSDFLGDDLTKLAGIKSYIYLRVKLLLDPPTSTSAIEAINRMVAELEWRLNIAADPGLMTKEEY